MKPRTYPTWLRIMPVLVLGAFILSGCDFQPKGSTIFKIEGRTEYDRAWVGYPRSAEARPPLRLRWVDTNTFITTATFSPGPYHFSARTGEGMHYGRDITIDGESRKYIMPERGSAAAAVREAAKVDGQVTVASGRMPSEIVILFIGKDFIVRRERLEKSSFLTEAPPAGKYLVEIHSLDEPPKSFYKKDVELKGQRLSLGMVTLN